MSRSWHWTSVDLARFRVVFAVVMLLSLPTYSWLDGVPDALHRPPAGVAALFPGFPPLAVLHVLDAALALSLAALAFGVRVTLASWTASLTMLLGSGLAFSLGKIDHNILLVLTPAVLSLAGWAPGARPRPQILRLWAFAVGTAMLTAGLAKLSGGWLDPGTHAVQGYVFQQVYAYDLTDWLGSSVTALDPSWIWEPMDWAAVVVECGLIVCAVWSLRAFRVGLAALSLFHLGVLLLMNIAFVGNLLAYAAFVQWSAARWPTPTLSAGRRTAATVAVGLTAWGLVELAGNAAELVGPVVLFVAAALGAWYLIHQVRSIVTRTSRSARAEALAS